VDRRPSAQTIAVLHALAADTRAWRYGYELGQEVGLKAGSLYPILMRLSDRGLLESSWERETPSGRPPRHLYRLSADGVRYAGEHAVASPAVAVPNAVAKTSRRTARRPVTDSASRVPARLAVGGAR
jgi:PadR family transcriptional regulator, regulatory protein PadR